MTSNSTPEIPASSHDDRTGKFEIRSTFDRTVLLYSGVGKFGEYLDIESAIRLAEKHAAIAATRRCYNDIQSFVDARWPLPPPAPDGKGGR